MMDDSTVPTPPEHRQPRRGPIGLVDLIIGLAGTAAGVVAFTAEPLVAVPAGLVMTAAGLALVHRNPGEGR